MNIIIKKFSNYCMREVALEYRNFRWNGELCVVRLQLLHWVQITCKQIQQVEEVVVCEELAPGCSSRRARNRCLSGLRFGWRPWEEEAGGSAVVSIGQRSRESQTFVCLLLGSFE
ncbi:hypothetical protein KFK09_013324 [Dendrobium nobile]|uniref:Uncharacterized protein n=1 Tax=Dendrobium nobile TaxID=94219 RepID=A0A8T3B996_DENNO|nr:hypothetical protein KFK09_013324 [Dendrobium nobile]